MDTFGRTTSGTLFLGLLAKVFTRRSFERPRVRRLHPLRRSLGTPSAGYSMTGIFASQSSFEPPTSRMN